MIEAEQYFSADSSIARPTASGFRPLPVTMKCMWMRVKTLGSSVRAVGVQLDHAVAHVGAALFQDVHHVDAAAAAGAEQHELHRRGRRRHLIAQDLGMHRGGVAGPAFRQEPPAVDPAHFALHAIRPCSIRPRRHVGAAGARGQPRERRCDAKPRRGKDRHRRLLEQVGGARHRGLRQHDRIRARPRMQDDVGDVAREAGFVARLEQRPGILHQQGLDLDPPVLRIGHLVQQLGGRAEGRGQARRHQQVPSGGHRRFRHRPVDAQGRQAHLAADLLRHAADAGAGAQRLGRALALQGGERRFDAGGDGVDREGIERLAQQHLAHAMHPADILRRQLGQQPVEPRAVRFGGVQQAQHAPGHSAALLKKMRVLS